ncbi:MAG: SOS response-associated peptidase family protein [Acidobacteriota bacterium]
MCGRYVRDISKEELIRYFNIVEGRDYFDIHGYRASKEVFPGTSIMAINNRRQPEDFWWTIEDKDFRGIMRRTINAKAETVAKVRMFADAFHSDRVLIPATGFFEWDQNKTRHQFTFDEPLFAFGGIARECLVKGEPRRCAVILTTEANDVVRPIHVKGRMPVVIRKYDHEKWLSGDTSIGELRQLMLPLKNEETHVAPAPSRSSTSGHYPENN